MARRDRPRIWMWSIAARQRTCGDLSERLTRSRRVRSAAFLVLLPAAAGARVVATDFWRVAVNGLDHGGGGFALGFAGGLRHLAAASRDGTGGFTKIF